MASLAIGPAVEPTRSTAEASVAAMPTKPVLTAALPASVRAHTASDDAAAHLNGSHKHPEHPATLVGVKEPKKVAHVKRVLKPDRGSTVDVFVAKRLRHGETTVAAFKPVSTPAKPYRLASASSAQRPFRSAKYWRLSFWEAKN